MQTQDLTNKKDVSNLKVGLKLAIKVSYLNSKKQTLHVIQ
jgi:hypothetical protein